MFIEKIIILNKYSDFTNIFSKQKALELPKIINLNQYAVELKKDKQQFYKLIHRLKPVKLKSFKTYIEINLISSFIWPLKLPAGAFILFV